MCCGLLTQPNYPFSELKEVSSSRVTSTSPYLLPRKRIKEIKNGRAGNVLAVQILFIYLEFLKNNNTKFRRKIVDHGPFGPTPGSAHVLEDFFPNLKVHKTFALCCFSFQKAEIIKKNHTFVLYSFKCGWLEIDLCDNYFIA